MKKRLLTLPIIFMFLATGCGNSETSSNSEGYEPTKTMILDVLKSEDGKKALREILSDDKMKDLLIMDQKVVKEAVQQTIISDKGKQFWKKAFKDPTFAAAYAKALKDEHQTLLKDLLKDPSYRKLLLEVLQDHEMEKEFEKAFKSTESRKVIKETIIETLQSPLVQSELMKIFKEGKGEGKEGGQKDDASQTDTNQSGGESNKGQNSSSG